MNENALSGGWLALIVIIVVIMFGGRLLGGGDGHISEIVNGAVNNQSTQNGIRDVLLSSANNNYETARLIQDQTMMMQQQNAANQVNLLQEYNALMLANSNQFAEIRQQMAQLGSQMEMCCCSIKTQMLQYRLDDSERRNIVLENRLSNYDQTQTLLGTQGRWVANPAVA